MEVLRSTAFEAGGWIGHKLVVKEGNVKFQIRAYQDGDIENIVELSLLAWEPVFRSFEQIFGAKIYSILYPDWRKSQKEGVEGVCKNTHKYQTIVAEIDGKVIGFLAYELKKESQIGEVILLAVHPEVQNDGIGTALNERALERIRSAGMKMAVVETGGDDSHAPARSTYEKVGYTAMPIVRYFKDL